MTRLEAALLEVCAILDDLRLPYMLIGGLAVALFLKLTSDRGKDLDDAERLLRRHRGRFNGAWLEGRLAEISVALSQPEILDRYRRLIEDR